MGDGQLIEKIREFGEKSFLVHKRDSYTYQDLLFSIDGWFKLLRSEGVDQGSVVAIVGDYSFTSIACFLALLKNKNIIVPITAKLEPEVEIQLGEAFVKWAVTFQEKNHHIEKRYSTIEPHALVTEIRNKNAAGLILFSSGSAGKPKAMIHDLDVLVDSFAGARSKNMVILVFLMFDHIGGINTLLNVLASGSKMVIPESRNAEEIGSLIEKNKVMVLPSTPTFLNLMLINDVHQKYDLSSLKIISYGTEPMPETLLTKLRHSFKKVRFIQTFGTSETGISKTTSKSSGSTSFRLDQLGGEHKIVDGELWLRSETQILGYLNHSMENFTKDGWFKTGDMVVQQGDGFFTIVGRNKEIINIGGEKVLPIEVESVLLQMPEVLDCMVYAEKNSITGSAVAAEVRLTEEMSPLLFRKKLRIFCRDRLAQYKIPTKIRVVESTSFGDRFKKMRISASKQ